MQEMHRVSNYYLALPLLFSITLLHLSTKNRYMHNMYTLEQKLDVLLTKKVKPNAMTAKGEMFVKKKANEKEKS